MSELPILTLLVECSTLKNKPMVYNAILVKKGFQHQLFLEQSYCSIVDLSDELDFCISCNYCGDYTENTRFHCLC